MLKGFTRKFKPLEILTEEQVESIHTGTLSVLRETGVRFESKKALKLFEKNGCQIDYSNNRVRFPEGLVEECLRKCPTSFRVKARNPKNDIILGKDTVYFSSFCGMQTINLDTWESRTSTRKEFYDGVTILDALNTVHVVPCYTPYFGFEGLPGVMAIPEGTAIRIRNSSKFTWAAYSKDSEIFTIQMAKALGMEIAGRCMASPPLTYSSEAVQSAFRHIEAGFPIDVASGPVFGGTAPATIAGSTITNNAEIIAGIVLAQLIKPGTRVWVDEYAFSQNMQTGAPNFGAIESSLHQVIFNQVWRRYKIPIHNGAGGPSNSKKIDFQCGYERANLVLLSALSGANEIVVHGGIYGEIAFHPVQAIIDDDLVGMIGRFLKGIDVNDETMALDLINEVGPIPGHYLSKAHTRKWWKKEQFIPKSADRLTYPEWLKTGKKSCIDYAKERMDEILATHKVDPPLTSSQEEDIEKILKEAREYYRKKELISDEEWETYKKDIRSPNYPYA